jgi:adenine deaminase
MDTADQQPLAKTIALAKGDAPADLIVHNVYYLDVFSGQFRAGGLVIAGKQIVATGNADTLTHYTAKKRIDGAGAYVVPGFIDTHVHIESSLMAPARYQETVLPLGTTTAIWDPHEIANVLGTVGIDWALSSTRDLLMDIFVMVPSCVPSTSPALEMETSGAHLQAEDLAPYANDPQVLGLAEMMNYPGLLGAEPDIMDKLALFSHKHRDGHCPGLTGKDLNAYAAAGIQNCHESTSLAEAEEKLSKGINVLIREGSCAKNAACLIELINAYTSTELALCSDDRNPLDILSEGHINFIVDLALKAGIAPEAVFRAAAYGPAKQYGLHHLGAIAPGRQADFLLIQPMQKSWNSGFQIVSTYKKGELVKADALAQIIAKPLVHPRKKNIHTQPISVKTLALTGTPGETQYANIIRVIPNQIITAHDLQPVTFDVLGQFQPEAPTLAKIVVIERHHNTGHYQVGLVNGFSLTHGAIATSINHDSHNIIAVGATDEAIVAAVNQLITQDGGIVVCEWDTTKQAVSQQTCLPLPLGGLMSDLPPKAISEQLQALKAAAKRCGCPLYEPFLQLSFLALPVIGAIKITDRGLVDVSAFEKIPLFTPHEPERHSEKGATETKTAQANYN